MSRVNVALLVSLGLLIAGSLPVHANQLVIKDGFGEGINVNKRWFGRKDMVIQDRLGDKVSSKKGWFGSKETEVNLFGNKFKKKKGWFGGSTIEANTILGDSIKSKKGWFGGRNTTVDASGISSAIRGFLKKDELPLPGAAGDAGLDPSLPPELQSLPPATDVPAPTYSGQ